MNRKIAIRREDKNNWERRAPLTPEDVRWLQEEKQIETVIQPSPIRVFSAAEYMKAGAGEAERMEGAPVVFAIKEIPAHLLEPGKTYAFFSHVIKGQPHNMPLLKRMMELKCNLIDYERIVDDRNRRLIFFGNFAGKAGMIETLKALGQKLELRGVPTPLSRIRHAYKYRSVDEAKQEIGAIGEEIARTGIPFETAPFTIGFAGYGNVSRGAQEIFDLLPHKVLSADVMREMSENFSGDTGSLYKIVFKEEDMVRRKQGSFDLQEYYSQPELYESKFTEYLPYLSALVNGIFWTDRYPRLVTKQHLQNSQMIRSNPKLLVIGDITCDINGSIQITYKSTKPDSPCYTYFPLEDRFEDGIDRLGITVMAVDNLPCEFPRESSQAFSSALREFVAPIATADFSLPYQELRLPEPVKTALILHEGRLTPSYEYLNRFIEAVKP